MSEPGTVQIGYQGDGVLIVYTASGEGEDGKAYSVAPGEQQAFPLGPHDSIALSRGQVIP